MGDPEAESPKATHHQHVHVEQHDDANGVVHAWLGQNVTEARYGHSKAASAPLILSGAGICYTKVYITFRATSAVEIQTYARATHGFASSE